jgi:hypothetical protein
MSVLVHLEHLYDESKQNQIECTNGCKNNVSPDACQHFCDCIYAAGEPLHACLDGDQSAQGSTPEARPDQ